MLMRQPIEKFDRGVIAERTDNCHGAGVSRTSLALDFRSLRLSRAARLHSDDWTTTVAHAGKSAGALPATDDSPSSAHEPSRSQKIEALMGNRLYVGNLSYNTSREALEAAFSSAGQVTEVAIPTDRETGQARGFAFITMSTDQGANAAIAELNGTMLDGRPLRVNEAQERPARGGGGGGGGNDGPRRGGHRGW
jgi:hypothetical protein